MPNLSPTMEKGNIKEWNVKVGDQIQPGDVLCGIETDKAVVDFEMQEEGYVAKLLFDAGTKDIPLGTPLAIIVESEADIAAFANYDGSGGAAAAPSTPAAPAQEAASTSAPVAAASAASYPEHIALEMPNLSPTMEKGNIKEWHKQVGDEVAPGDVLCGIETDKAVVDFEMQEEGYVAAILYPDGAKDIELGKIVAVIVENKDDIDAFKNYTADSAAAPSAPAQ